MAVQRAPAKQAGYSGTPLWKKIGIKQGHRVRPIGMPKRVGKALSGVPDHEHVETDADVVWLFAADTAALDALLPDAVASMRRDGMLWISWPKKASGVETDLDGGAVREAGLAAGLVDVKVCAVDETWSGHKFVVRRKDR